MTEVTGIEYVQMLSNWLGLLMVDFGNCILFCYSVVRWCFCME